VLNNDCRKLKPNTSFLNLNVNINLKEKINRTKDISNLIMNINEINEQKQLNFLQKIMIKVFGSIQTGYTKKKGWKGYAPIYAFKCPKHGIVQNTASGHRLWLICPQCLTEERLKDEIIQQQEQNQLIDIITTPEKK
jgi:hypothetical protein